MNIKAELFLTFMKVGAFTFGGGYAMIALLDRECVTGKEWLTQEEFMDMAAIAESTPGPVAINCATYIGYKKAGISGAFLATLGVVLPSFFILFLISSYMEDFMEYKAVENAFKGIRVAVAILIIQAGWRMGGKLLKEKENRIKNIIFLIIALILVFLLNLYNINFSTIYLILIAGFFGAALYRRKEENNG